MPVARKVSRPSAQPTKKQAANRAGKVVSFPTKKEKNTDPGKVKKIYVIDTSVLLHDHNAINNFEENYVAIPITVLEELDKFKVGNDIKNFEAREVIRIIDRLSSNTHCRNGFHSAMVTTASSESSSMVQMKCLRMQNTSSTPRKTITKF